MSNNIYDLARYSFATAQLNWTSANLTFLVFSGTPDFDPTDDRISDITGRGNMAFVKESQAINHKTVSPTGYLQTDKILVPTVPIGAQITAFVFALKGADIPTSTPVLFLDTAQGLPFTPNGLDMLIQPDWLQQRGWARV